MSSPSRFTNPTAATEHFGCLVIHKTPDELTIRSSFTFGRFIQTLYSLPWISIAILAGLATGEILDFVPTIRNSRFFLAAWLTFFGLALLYLVAMTVASVAFTTTLRLHNGSLYLNRYGLMGYSSQEISPYHLPIIQNGLQRFEFQLCRSHCVFFTYSNGSVLNFYRGTAAECRHVASTLCAAMEMAPSVSVSPSIVSAVTVQFGPAYIYAWHGSLLSWIPVVSFCTLGLTILGLVLFLGPRWMFDLRYPMLFLLFVIPSAVGAIIDWLIPWRFVSLSRDGLQLWRYGRRPVSWSLPIDDLSHFSLDERTLLAHRNLISSPTSDSLPLFSSLRPQDATFLLDQLTTTITTLKKTP